MIEVHGLVKHYGSVEAVKNLDLEVPAGEIFCFLGPNGAGKTTTIKMMTGLLHPTAGSVKIDGVDMLTAPIKAKQRLGYIPDMPFLYERLTASEFFNFTGELYGLDNALIARREEEYFDLFGLSERRETLVREFSHGMRQRLIYASTLLHEPKVLFVDEPLIGLDPYTIRLIKDLLVGRAGNGMTVFLTTHILTLAEDIADRIGIIIEGRLLALGSLADIKKQSGADTLEDAFLSLTMGDGDEALRR